MGATCKFFGIGKEKGAEIKAAFDDALGDRAGDADWLLRAGRDEQCECYWLTLKRNGSRVTVQPRPVGDVLVGNYTEGLRGAARDSIRVALGVR